MDVHLRSISWFGAGFALSGICQQRNQHLFSQNNKGRHCAQTIKGGLVGARLSDAANQFLSSKFLQVIGGLAGLIRNISVAHNFPYLCGKLRCGECSWVGGKCDNSFHHRPHSGLVNVYTRDATSTNVRWEGPCFQLPSIDKGNVHAAQNSKESLQYCLQRLYDPGKLADISPTWQVPAVVHNDLDSQHAFAFAINLDCHLAKMDLENSQIIGRSLDHYFEARPFTVSVSLEGTMLTPLRPKMVLMVFISSGARVRSITLWNT